MGRLLANDSEHRRGLVLGLTLAEILILLLFLLMLALGARLSSLLSQAKQAAVENANLRSATESLRPVLEAINRSGKMQINGIQELVERMGRLSEIEKTVEDLRRKNSDMEAALTIVRDLGQDAPQKLRALDRVFSAAARIDPSDPPAALKRALSAFEKLGQPDSDQIGLLSDMLQSASLSSASAKDFASAVSSAAKIDPRDPAGVLKRSLEVTEKLSASGMPASVNELVSQLEAGRGALASAVAERDRFKLEKDNLVKGGRGLMYPSCWIAPNGDTEYIFDINITDTGLTVNNSAPEYRQTDEAWKLIDQFPMGREIAETQFRSSTARLNTWSRERDCRFVVNMRDATGPQSKERYKQLQRLIEGHFYVRRLELARTPNAGPVLTNQTEGRAVRSDGPTFSPLALPSTSPTAPATTTSPSAPPARPRSFYDPGRVE